MTDCMVCSAICCKREAEMPCCLPEGESYLEHEVKVEEDECTIADHSCHTVLRQ